VRVLVVEDEEKIANGIRRGLESEGYAVDTVADGRQVPEWTSAFPFDLVILDLVLPGAGGLDVCANLRRSGFSAPILILTALDAVDDRVAGLDAGADDYLAKPFAMAELQARVRALLRRGSGTRSPTIRVGDVELEPDSRRVWLRDREVRLTAREFALLEFLARHAGQVFSQGRLIEALWSADFTIESNIVEVYIRSLRRKLDGGRRDGRIETVRGAGYRLRDERAT
jgi:DNA-binding response OmpR family regulator